MHIYITATTRLGVADFDHGGHSQQSLGNYAGDIVVHKCNR